MREMTFDFIKKAGISELRAGFWALTQSPLKVGFVSLHPIPQFLSLANAKRPENTAFFLQRRSTHTLWRHGACSAFLQLLASAPSAATVCADSLSRRRLSSKRSDPGSHLFSHRGIASHQPHRNPAIQWD